MTDQEIQQSVNYLITIQNTNIQHTIMYINSNSSTIIILILSIFEHLLFKQKLLRQKR